MNFLKFSYFYNLYFYFVTQKILYKYFYFPVFFLQHWIKLLKFNLNRLFFWRIFKKIKNKRAIYLLKIFRKKWYPRFSSFFIPQYKKLTRINLYFQPKILFNFLIRLKSIFKRKRPKKKINLLFKNYRLFNDEKIFKIKYNLFFLVNNLTFRISSFFQKKRKKRSNLFKKSIKKVRNPSFFLKKVYFKVKLNLLLIPKIYFRKYILKFAIIKWIRVFNIHLDYLKRNKIKKYSSLFNKINQKKNKPFKFLSLFLSLNFVVINKCIIIKNITQKFFPIKLNQYQKSVWFQKATRFFIVWTNKPQKVAAYYFKIIYTSYFWQFFLAPFWFFWILYNFFFFKWWKKSEPFFWDFLFKMLNFTRLHDFWQYLLLLKNWRWKKDPNLLLTVWSLKSNFEYGLKQFKKNWKYDYIFNRIWLRTGYQVFFRKLRVDFKIIHNLNFRYQKKLTKYILKYRHVSFYSLIYVSQFTLQNILFFSKFFPYWDYIQHLILNKWVFVNDRLNTNVFYFLQIFDRIRIIWSYKYYFLFRVITKYFWRSYYYLKLKTWGKLPKSKHNWKHKRLKAFYKTFRFIFTFSDIPTFLEVDYMSLTLIILYWPFLYSDYNWFDFLFVKNIIIKNYNWKYIT